MARDYLILVLVLIVSAQPTWARTTSTDLPGTSTPASASEDAGGSSQRQRVPAPSLEEMGDMSIEELLQLNLFESEMEVTAATKGAVHASEAPSIVTVIPRAAILARGYRSVGEALAGVPGLYVIDDLVTSNVSIRGIHGGADSWSRLVKVMVDGRPVTFYSTGGTLLGPEFFPMDAIESIEVIRGPASALYGANAFLGVINIVSRKSEVESYLRVGGEIGLIRESLSEGGSLFGSVASESPHKASFVVAATAQRLDRSGLGAPPSSPQFERYRGELSKNDISRPVSVFAKGIWDGEELGTVELRLIHQRMNAHAAFSEISALAAKNRFAVVNTILRADYKRFFLGDQLHLGVFASGTLGETLPMEVLDAADVAFTVRRKRKNVAGEVGVDLRYSYDTHSILAGVDYLLDRDSGDTLFQVSRQNGDMVRRVKGRDFTYSDLGLFVQAVAYPLSGLGVIAGVRYDYNSVWDDTFNSRVGVVYEVSPGIRVKTLYGSSFVPPAPTQLHAEPVNSGGVRGNSDNLESQTAKTLETALSYQLGEHLSLQINGFWTRIEERIESVAVGGNLTARNLADSSTFGTEGLIEFRWNPTFVRANVSWQHTSIEKPDDPPSWWQVVYDPDGKGGDGPPAFPAIMGHLTAGVTLAPYHLQGTVTTNVAGRRKSSQDNIRLMGESYSLDGYVTFDANIRTFDLTLLGERPIDIGLHVTNLLNARYAEAGYLGVDIPSLGRTVFLKVTLVF